MTLVIDTAHRIGMVAMENGSERLIDTRSDPLAQVVQELWNAPERIAVGRGPGSYTGMRVGLAFAKGLSMASGVPLVGFSSLQAHVPQKDGPFVSAFDARAGGAYFQLGSRHGDVVEWEEPRVGGIEELAQVCRGRRLVSPDCQELIRRLPKMPEVEESRPDPRAILRLTLGTNVEALYMRKTQAERALET